MKPVRALLVSSCAAVSCSLLAQDAGTNIDRSSNAINLSEFVISEHRSRGYLATNATSATRIDMPISEIPMNIQVLTEDFIKDTLGFAASSRDQREAISWIAAAGGPNGKSLRGFNTGEFLRNGFFYLSDSPTTNVARIEVIKGPNAILDGTTQPGGIINVITKLPVANETFTNLRYVHGVTRDRQTATIDYNNHGGSRGPRGSLLNYRLVVGAEYWDSVADVHENKRILIAPSLLFLIGRDTTLTVDYEHNNLDLGRGQSDGDDSLRTDNDIPYRIAFGTPEEFSYAGPDSNKGEDINNLMVSLEHRFTPDLVLNIRGNYHDRRVKWDYEPVLSTVNHPVNGERAVRRGWQRENSVARREDIRADLFYQFETGSIDHRLVVGVQNNETRNSFLREVTTELNSNDRYYEYFSLSDPNPDLRNKPYEYRWTYGFGSAELGRPSKTRSYFANHQGRFMDERLITLAGLYKTEVRQSDGTKLISEYLPQVGALYRLTERVGLFANYAESAIPSGRRDGFDRLLGPTTGSIAEVGVKTRILNERLTGTFSVYRIKQSNDVQFDPEAPNQNTDPNNPNSPRGAFVPVGESSSEGFDVDLLYRPVPNWDMVLSYAYNDARIDDNVDPATIGRYNSSAFVRNRLTYWTKYTFTDGPLNGFAVGGGFKWNSDFLRFYRGNTPYWSKPQYEASLLISYDGRWGRNLEYTVSLSGKNINSPDQAVGVKPGTSDPFYFDREPEYYLTLDLRF